MAAACAACALAAALAVLGLPAAVGANGYGVAGPYRINIEHVLPCSPDQVDLPCPTIIKLRRDRHHTSQFYASGNITTSFTMNDSYSFVGDFESWSSRGGWKPNALRFDFPRVCAFMRTTVPDTWRRLMADALGDPDRQCPMPPDTYTLKNFSLSLDKEIKAAPVFFYGKYRATWHILHTATRQRVVCTIVTSSIIPRYGHH